MNRASESRFRSQGAREMAPQLKACIVFIEDLYFVPSTGNRQLAQQLVNARSRCSLFRHPQASVPMCLHMHTLKHTHSGMHVHTQLKIKEVLKEKYQYSSEGSHLFSVEF